MRTLHPQEIQATAGGASDEFTVWLAETLNKTQPGLGRALLVLAFPRTSLMLFQQGFLY